MRVGQDSKNYLDALTQVVVSNLERYDEERRAAIRESMRAEGIDPDKIPPDELERYYYGNDDEA
jgi:hypothetical protein